MTQTPVYTRACALSELPTEGVLGVEVAGEPGELRWRRVRHVRVDRDFDQIGPHDVAAGFEDNRQRL